MMPNCRLIFAAILILGNFAIDVTSTYAQTTNPEVNRLLQQSNEMVYGNDTRTLIQEASAEAERYQYYLLQLYSNCVNYGDAASCNEYTARRNAQLNHMNQLQEQYNSYYGSDWSNSFRY